MLTQRFALVLPASILPARGLFTTQFGTNEGWVDWGQVEKAGCTPVTGENMMAQRWVLRRHWEMSMAEV